MNIKITLLTLAFCFAILPPAANAQKKLRCKKVRIEVQSLPGTQVYYSDTMYVMPKRSPVRIWTPCEGGQVQLILKKDSLLRHINVRSIQRKKAWEYPDDEIYVQMTDTGNIYYKYKPFPPQRYTFNISLFPVAGYFMRPDGKDSTNASIGGLAVGINKYLNYKRFLSAEVGVAQMIFHPGLRGDTVAISYAGSFFANSRYNWVLGPFDIGCGPALSLHRIDYREHIYSPIKKETQKTYSNFGLGGSFSSFVHCGRILAFGLLYQPQLLSFSRGIRFQYEHSIFLEVTFRMPQRSQMKN